MGDIEGETKVHAPKKKAFCPGDIHRVLQLSLSDFFFMTKIITTSGKMYLQNIFINHFLFFCPLLPHHLY